MAEDFTAKLDFRGRVALVTGGASGIGFAVANQLAELGAQIAIADINSDGAETAAAKLAASGAEVMTAQVDVRDRDAVELMVDAIVRRFGKIDILVHSAGVGIERAFLDTSAEEWCRVIDIDLSGTFYCAQAAARRMAENGYGRIVTLSSRPNLSRACIRPKRAGPIGPVFPWIATVHRTRSLSPPSSLRASRQAM
jgi:NAD(P)-dependent dehydrogenase (short-subunit alcohol dehydrogenase family)